MPHFYSAFGGRVCSEIPLPELPRLEPGPADWTLSLSPCPHVQPPGAVLGASTKGECEVTLWRSDAGFRMRHTCVGEYDISADGSSIACWRDAGTPDVAVQNDLIGRILPLTFHAAGALCLHASGVVIEGNAIAFVGEPRIGKSTLAYALVQQGARVNSDDVVILETRPSVVMRRGVERLRLCRDVTERMVREDTPRRSSFDGKDVIELHSADSVVRQTTPLRAVYLLAPFRARRRDAVARRVPVWSHTATLLLVRHARLGRVLSGSSAGDMVVRAAAVVREVPVYVLHVARDIGRIDEVASQVMRWHGDVPRDGCATGTNG